jgi:hypothetical protein
MLGAFICGVTADKIWQQSIGMMFVRATPDGNSIPSPVVRKLPAQCIRRDEMRSFICGDTNVRRDVNDLAGDLRRLRPVNDPHYDWISQQWDENPNPIPVHA